MVINHQQMKLFFAFLRMNSGNKHAAGFDAHHGTRRQIGDGNAGLPNQFLRLIISMDTAQNYPVFFCSVVQSELSKLLGLCNRLAGPNLYGAEIGLGEGLEIDEIGKQRLNFHL